MNQSVKGPDEMIVEKVGGDVMKNEMRWQKRG
jgi:hypothetical protein